MRVARWLLALVACGCLALTLAPRPASAAPRPMIVVTADDAATGHQFASPSSAELATDYMLIIAGVGAWATLTVWLATRHRRRLGAAFWRRAACVGDEAEEWLRGQ